MSEKKTATAKKTTRKRAPAKSAKLMAKKVAPESLKDRVLTGAKNLLNYLKANLILILATAFLTGLFFTINM